MKVNSFLPLLALSTFAAAQVVTNGTATPSKAAVFTDLDSFNNIFPPCNRPCMKKFYLDLFSTDVLLKNPKCVITGEKNEKVDFSCLCAEKTESSFKTNTTEAVKLVTAAESNLKSCLAKAKETDPTCTADLLTLSAIEEQNKPSCKATLEAAGKGTDSKDAPKNDPKNKDEKPSTTDDAGTKSDSPKSNPSSSDAPSLAGSGAKILLGGTVSLATFAFAAFVGATNFLI